MHPCKFTPVTLQVAAALTPAIITRTFGIRRRQLTRAVQRAAHHATRGSSLMTTMSRMPNLRMLLRFVVGGSEGQSVDVDGGEDGGKSECESKGHLVK